MRVLMSGATPVLGCADKVKKIKTNYRRFKGKCNAWPDRAGRGVHSGRRYSTFWAISLTLSAGTSPTTVTR
jgi:hypothetical protein